MASGFWCGVQCTIDLLPITDWIFLFSLGSAKTVSQQRGWSNYKRVLISDFQILAAQVCMWIAMMRGRGERAVGVA